MSRELIPYNVMRHARWDAAPREPVTSALAVFKFLGFTGLKAVAAYVAVSAVTSWALAALTPKPDFGALSSAGLMVNAREAAAPHDVVYGQVRKGGVVTYYESTGTDNKFLHQVISVAGHEVEELGDIYINDEKVTLDSNGFVTGDKWKSKIRINKHLGDQTTADADLLNESNQVDGNFVGNGIAYLYVRFEYDQDVFANGLPLITTVVKGKKVFDPRNGTTAYSANAALCLRDYIFSDYGLNDDDIDDVVFQAAANISDEQVTLKDGVSTENRYEMNGVIKAGTKHGDVINRMVTTCAGTLFWGAGNWKLTAGAYSAPTKTLTLDDLRGPISLSTRTNLRDQFNIVQGKFNEAPSPQNPDARWITEDYPQIKGSAFIAEDGGEEQTLDFELPLTTSSAMAQRLAKLTLFRGREQMTFSADFGLNAFDVEVGEIVALSIDRYGWVQKEFEVIGWNMGPNAEQGDTRISLTLRETSEAAFDWNAEEKDIINNNTNLPDFTVGVGITGLTASGGGRTQSDGTFINTAILSWDEADNSFVNQYEVQWKPVADSSYSSTFTSDTTIELSPITDSVEYVFRVRAVSDLGNRGTFSSTTFTVGGDISAPGPVTGLTAVGAFQSITISYIPPADADWSAVNVYEGPDNSFANATKIGSSSGDVFYRLNLPNDITRFYWVETVDFSGNTGPVVGPVSATTRLIEENDFTQGLQDTLDAAGVRSVNSLPASGEFDNEIVLLLSDFTLYRWDDSAGVWDDTLFTSIEDNSVTTNSIVANAIIGSKIAAGAVTADKISVNELTAVAATIGTFQSAPTGERVVISDDVIEVYDASNQLRVRIGNLNP